jgi:protein-S-isoprenylcysteine O-methyltransferase Ste14
MRATNWEFANRAFLIGTGLGAGFAMYALDSKNVTNSLARALAARFPIDANWTARLLFIGAALVLAAAAAIRTWASAFLNAGVVYALDVKSASLVADGPYRHVRNPLYLGNLLMAVGFGAMMSRLGILVSIASTTFVVYRLILREEQELSAAHGEGYLHFCAAVPRLWPSLRPRVASSGQQPPNLCSGLKAEAWAWGFALSVLGFAVTSSIPVFSALLVASLVLFWISSSTMRRRGGNTI